MRRNCRGVSLGILGRRGLDPMLAGIFSKHWVNRRISVSALFSSFFLLCLSFLLAVTLVQLQSPMWVWVVVPPLVFVGSYVCLVRIMKKLKKQHEEMYARPGGAQ